MDGRTDGRMDRWMDISVIRLIT